MEQNDKIKEIKNITARVFLVLEGLVFALFVVGGIYGRQILLSANVWQFSVVVLAFLYAAFEFILTKRGDEFFTRRLFLLVALAFTLVSDLFLTLLGIFRTLAVVIFVLAQIFHALQIRRGKKRAILSFSLRFCASLAAVVVLAVLNILTPLYAAVAFYAPQLVGNLVEHIFDSFRLSDPTEKRRSVLLSVAFALFLACDVCIGLSEIGVTGVGFFVWIFYAPSQVLIAISAT